MVAINNNNINSNNNNNNNTMESRQKPDLGRHDS